MTLICLLCSRNICSAETNSMRENTLDSKHRTPRRKNTWCQEEGGSLEAGFPAGFSAFPVRLSVGLRRTSEKRGLLPGIHGSLVSSVEESKTMCIRKLGRVILLELGRKTTTWQANLGSCWVRRLTKLAMPLKWGPRKQASSEMEVTEQLPWEDKGRSRAAENWKNLVSGQACLEFGLGSEEEPEKGKEKSYTGLQGSSKSYCLQGGVPAGYAYSLIKRVIIPLIFL